MKTLKLNDDEISVLLQSLHAVAWPALPKAHFERLAYLSVERKLSKLMAQEQHESTPA